MKSFEEALKEVKDSLYNQKEVEDYFALKAAIQNNEALQELEKEINFTKRQLTLSINDEEKHRAIKERYLSLKSQYENHPLVQNFYIVKEELYDLLMQMKNILEK